MAYVSVVQGDIVRYPGMDAIVTDGVESLLGGDGVDAEVHRVGGQALYEACLWVPEIEPGLRCRVGEAKLTYGGDLPVRYVIHTVGPHYYQHDDPEGALRSCYHSCLALADRMGFKRIAFPAISCGVKEFPHPLSARIGLSVANNGNWAVEQIRFVIYESFGYEDWLRAYELA